MASSPPAGTSFLEASGRKLHYETVGTGLSGSSLVFLHEGLGSVDLWRDLPKDVVDATGHPGLIYSRYGNGWSPPLEKQRRPDYMHQEALQVLPDVVGRLLHRAPVLVGHSDGASIALIYAGSGHPVEALVLIAPHVFVEGETIVSIASIRDAFPESDMATRMAKYHRDPESTFHGWADVWLSSAFRTWNIEEYLPGVSCPVLLIQGDADQYGTTRQLDSIADTVTGPVTTVVVKGAGHSPHLSHRDEVTAAVVDFIGGIH